MEKENLTDKINLSGPPTNDPKYTVNQIFDLHDPRDTIPLSKLEVEIFFLPPTEKFTLQLFKKIRTLILSLDISINGKTLKQKQQKLILQS